MVEAADPNGLLGMLNNPLVLLVIGWVAAKWQRDQGQHTKSVQVDAELMTRLANVETWQRDHNTIHGCVQSLKATTEGVAKNVDRLTRRVDAFLAALPPMTLRQRARSPFDFPGARDWIDEDEDWRPV